MRPAFLFQETSLQTFDGPIKVYIMKLLLFLVQKMAARRGLARDRRPEIMHSVSVKDRARSEAHGV